MKAAAILCAFARLHPDREVVVANAGHIDGDSHAEAGPRPSLAIGVTGHRPPRLGSIDPGAIAARIDAVLAAIDAAAAGAMVKLIGSLAEGADMLFADAAHRRGWRVDAVLPFPCGDYAADFATPEAAAAFARRLAGAADVFELPGRRDEPGGAAAAYERAGRIVLAQSDLLVALWDGAAPAGRGGTAQIVAEAVQRRVPVIVIDPHGDAPAALLWNGLDATPKVAGIDTVTRTGLAALPALFASLRATTPAAQRHDYPDR